MIYHDGYNKNLLQRISRNLHRKLLGINYHLPFFGADIWTLYEVSWLNNKGIPEIAVAEVIVDAKSKYLIESKSFKLYLNRFNQTKFLSWDIVYETLKDDIVSCVQGDVSIKLFHLKEIEGKLLTQFDGYCIDYQDLEIDNYQFNPSYLYNIISNDIVEEKLVSNLFKSNCPITNQPDWGSIMICYHGYRINHDQLLRYLISFRKHSLFHEQCVENIFNDILRFCYPKSLTVYARYTRRGGLDINPWRSNTKFSPTYSRLVRQ